MQVTVEKRRCPQNHKCPAIRVCPVDAISQDGYKAPVINQEKCIKCMKCVRYCATGAIQVSN